MKSEKTSIAGSENKKLFPTDVGIVVTDFLVAHFSDIMNYSFTASVETEFDEIAAGKKVWNQMIAAFYGSFHKKVEDVIGSAGKASGERELGVDPISGYKVFARIVVCTMLFFVLITLSQYATAKPYELPTFSDKESKKHIKPFNEPKKIDYEKIFMMVNSCYPAKSWFDIDLSLCCPILNKILNHYLTH